MIKCIRILLVGCMIVNLCGSVFAEEAVPKDSGEIINLEALHKEIEDNWNKEKVDSTAMSVSDIKDSQTNESQPAASDGTTKQAADAPATPAVTIQADTTPRYDFTLQNMKLTDALYGIALRAGKNMSINCKLEGTVMLTVKGKTFQEVLNILANTFNFNWMVDGDTIQIGPSDTMLQTKRFILHNGNLQTLQNAKNEIVSMGISEKGINVNPDYNAISVTATPYLLDQTEKKIQDIDKPVAQCLIVAQMVEVSHGDSIKLGPLYTMPSYGYSKSSGSSSTTLTYAISSDATKALSNSRVLTRPMALAMNGQEADITMGSKVPVLTTTTTSSSTSVTVTYQDIGNELKVTPIINKEDMSVGLSVNAKVSYIEKWTTSGSVSAPQISSREAKTAARIKSGETLVIGGMMTDSEIDNLTGIPGIMNIPILGNLFKYHSKSKDNTEVYVLITPYIVDGGLNLSQVKKLQ